MCIHVYTGRTLISAGAGFFVPQDCAFVALVLFVFFGQGLCFGGGVEGERVLKN